MLPFILSLSKGRLKGVFVRHCVSPVNKCCYSHKAIAAFVSLARRDFQRKHAAKT
jgi:hypothetical protein